MNTEQGLYPIGSASCFVVIVALNYGMTAAFVAASGCGTALTMMFYVVAMVRPR